MARKIGWWYAKKMLIIIVFLVSMITMSQAVQVHASGPVIDDQLHILTSAQKQQIYTENENLANSRFTSKSGLFQPMPRQLKLRRMVMRWTLSR